MDGWDSNGVVGVFGVYRLRLWGRRRHPFLKVTFFFLFIFVSFSLLQCAGQFDWTDPRGY